MIDAWQQYYNLQNKYSTRVEVRRDLIVEALGLERAVRFTLVKEPLPGVLELPKFHNTQRNASTMRELGQALIDAADYVEEVNPKWARQSG